MITEGYSCPLAGDTAGPPGPRHAHPLDSQVLNWFHSGRVGSSSRCMAYHLTGRRCDGSCPVDASDFALCVKLLDAVPGLRPLLPRMAEVSRRWAALLPRWADIEASTNPAWVRAAIGEIIAEADGEKKGAS